MLSVLRSQAIRSGAAFKIGYGPPARDELLAALPIVARAVVARVTSAANLVMPGRNPSLPAADQPVSLDSR